MRTWYLRLALCILLASLLGCRPDESGSLEQAAAEATALVARAEATAIILRAQAEATAMLLSAASPATAAPQPSSSPAAPAAQQVSILPSASATGTEQAPSTLAAVPATPGPGAASRPALADGQVEIESVGYAGEGGFIIIYYRASYKTAQNFWPGRVSLTDQATGTVYSEVPNMPLIGPLIARPAQEDQESGYVMLVNNPPLTPGSKVKVVLDTYQEENLVIK